MAKARVSKRNSKRRPSGGTRKRSEGPTFAWRYTGLRVRDLPANIDFFTKGLGMRVRFQFRIKETGGKIVELVSGDNKHYLELNWYPPGTKFASRYTAGEALDHLMFRVKKGTMKDAIARLEAHGGKLVIPPFVEGKVLLAYVNGPDGHTVELVTRENRR